MSTSFQQDWHQVAFGPGGRGTSHEPKHDADPGGARLPHLSSAPWRPDPGRAVPLTNGHQSTAESAVLLVVCKEKDEGEAEFSRRGLRRTTRH